MTDALKQAADVGELLGRLAPLGVRDLQPLTGGASSLTYVGACKGGEHRRVVVKVAPAGVAPVRNRDVLRQARLLRALEPTSVPVPKVLMEDQGAPPEIPPLFVTEFVAGTSLEPLFDHEGDEDEAVVADRMSNAARAMAGLHALSLNELGLEHEAPVPLAAEIERWCRALETVDPPLAPGWELAADALRAREPSADDDATSVLHGDFRLGNTLAVGPRIAAVIDWEIWSVGDPRVDVGWFLVNADPATYRRETRYAHSVPPLSQLAQLYADALGRAVLDLEWFQALACFKSTATWSLIIKHNRRRPSPDPAIEDISRALPHLLERIEALLS